MRMVKRLRKMEMRPQKMFFRYRVIDIGRRLETDAQLAGIFGKMTFFTGFTP